MAKGFTDQVRDGMDVFDANNQKVGTVAETAEGYLRVPTGFLGMGKERYIPLSAIRSVDGEAIHLSVARDRLDELEYAQAPMEADGEYDGTAVERTTTTTTTRDTPGAPRPAIDGEQTLELREEELSARKHSVQTGQVEVAKEVVSEQRTIDVPVTHEEVTIERRAVDHQPSDSPIRDTDATISIPVREEQVTADKRAVVYEEVNIGKRAVQDTEHVSETVRREQAVVDKEGAVKIEGEKLA
jgi:uncharacterized protein (TIGR02271 family)